MKYRQLLAAAFYLVAQHISAVEPDTALLSNGNFETLNAATWPAGWAQPKGAAWLEEGGKHFVRLQTEKPGEMVMLFRPITLPTPPPPAVQFSLRLRYADVVPGKQKWLDARVIAHFKSASGRTLKPEPPTPAFHGSSTGWVDRIYVAKVPVGARTLEIMPSLFQCARGTLDIARCEVSTAAADQLPQPPPIIPSTTIVPEAGAKLPPELKVVGNQLQTTDGKPVWLQGLCVDSLEWSGAGEHLKESIPVAIEQWHANVIRLPVKDDFWFGRGPWQKKGEGGLAYRKIVDGVIAAAAARGAYVALDLHRFGAPMPEHSEFWRDTATRYKNHPAGLCELFNEAHSLSWKLWRDGGNITASENKHADANAAENKEELTGEVTTGMQALLDAVRATGARNAVIVGGLDWGYDLSGVAGDYALAERGGNGLIYSSHIYPWKNDWKGKVLAAAEKFP
ncbi:MAG: cellulase family glycosylhydrolase, partial [Kiritimatiellaeota bacterium]|nr:cellulase family glycosylhydrolase [Kiritimatiellota bacterium]